jgi:hypothetical protein
MLWIPFLVPLAWLLICPVIAALGGWLSLAQAFPGARRSDGTAYAWQSVQLGLFGNYNNCIDVTVGPAGIHLLPILLFRSGHPPILIPWSAVRACTATRRFLRKATRIELAVNTSSLTLLGDGGAEVLRQWTARGTA